MTIPSVSPSSSPLESGTRVNIEISHKKDGTGHFDSLEDRCQQLQSAGKRDANAHSFGNIVLGFLGQHFGTGQSGPLQFDQNLQDGLQSRCGNGIG